MFNTESKPKILLHVCCAPCLTSVYESLKDDYDITLFWFNPNIFPVEEYIKRLEELVKFAQKLELPLIIEGDFVDDHHNWIKLTQEHSNEPEGGKRCKTCFKYRLLNAAKYASENEFGLFGTTLSVSPYKDTMAINEIGKEIANSMNLSYLDRDFKENDGYKKSIDLCREYKIYRQKYCGCEYSTKDNC